MQTKLLHSSGLLTGVILLGCALALPVGAKGNRQVTRPLKGLGLATVVVTPISPTTGTFHTEEDGNATHVGLYHNVGNGTISLETGDFTGQGTMTAANGDTIHWVSEAGVTLFDGGTGRFENASGFMLMNVLFWSEPVDNGDGTFTITILYKPEGELTF